MKPHSKNDRRYRMLTVAVVCAIALMSSACVADGGGEPPDDASGQAVNQDEPAPLRATTIRLAIPSEPLWRWLVDSGSVAAWEAQHDLQIEASHPFRPFTALASGRADIVVMNAFEVPIVATDLDRLPVIIGKYASDRSTIAVRRSSRATELSELVDGRIALEGQLGSTLLWALIADVRHDLDLRYGSTDFEFVTATVGIADAVVRGNADACICAPNEAVSEFSSGALRPLYEGKTAATVYAEMMVNPATLPLGRSSSQTRIGETHIHMPSSPF